MSSGWRLVDWCARWEAIPAQARRLVLGLAALVAFGAWALALLLAG